MVRLNEPEYDGAAFAARGIAHHDLEFEDCTPPPEPVVAAFLRLAAAAPGSLAVHCKAGLGRTGTLIARYMMARHAFRPREAVAWLRIMRPGSVIGAQQHYLARLAGEGADGEAGGEGGGGGGGGGGGAAARVARGGGAAAAAVLAAQVAEGMERRGAARVRGGGGAGQPPGGGAPGA